MNIQIWQHKTSGEKYVVEVDEQGKVTACYGPLHYTEVEQARTDGVVNPEPEDVDWMNEHSEDFVLA